MATTPCTRIGDLTMDGAAPGALYLLASRIDAREGRFDLLHVMSVPAGGEIRGYAREVDSGAPWAVRLPNYTGHWPELDAAVSALTGEAVQS